MYDWIVANGVALLAGWFAFEKLVNVIVGLTATKEDDLLWDKVKSVSGWVLNTKSHT